MYSVVFMAVSSMATLFIVPLLLVSTVASALVVFFNGVSYASFRLAAAKYSRSVLFLNRLLRRIADNIPPSVGIVEVETENGDSNVRKRLSCIWTKLMRSTGVGAAEERHVTEVGEHMPVSDTEPNILGPDAPVIYDEDPLTGSIVTGIDAEQNGTEAVLQRGVDPLTTGNEHSL